MIVWEWDAGESARWDIRKALECAHRVALAHGWGVSQPGGVAQGVVCLHTARVEEAWGAWTYIAACPQVVLEGRVGSLTKTERGHRSEVAQGPFEAVRSLLRRAEGWEVVREGVFSGGALGYWGYGCRAVFEGVDGDDEESETDLWWGLYDTVFAHNHTTGETWVASQGWNGQGCDDALARHRLDAWRAAWRTVRSCEREELGAGGVVLQARVDLGRYTEMFHRVQEGIASGEMYQACLTYPMQCVRDVQTTAYRLFLELARENPAPFASLVVPTSGVSVASASPERFMSVRGGRVVVRPMKGTRPRAFDAHEDARRIRALLESEKDRAENVMIVDLMRNDLGRVCEVGSVQVPELFTVETHSDVLQMTSTIVGRLASGCDAVDAVRSSFPPGSMTGAPKVKAMEVLRALEVEPRGVYAGVLGWLCPRGDAELCVVIRSALVTEDRVVWHVGGGVVADSTLVGEWEEAQSKCPERWRAPAQKT